MFIYLFAILSVLLYFILRYKHSYWTRRHIAQEEQRFFFGSVDKRILKSGNPTQFVKEAYFNLKKNGVKHGKQTEIEKTEISENRTVVITHQDKYMYLVLDVCYIYLHCSVSRKEKSDIFVFGDNKRFKSAIISNKPNTTYSVIAFELNIKNRKVAN